MAASPQGRQRARLRLLCAEHNGDIASYANLDVKLADLVDWNEFFKRDSMDVRAVAKTALVAVSIAGVVVPIGMLAAPALAARIGALGLLGATAKGTAIRSLAGAALKNASLAYIGGGGGMVLGKGVIAATAAALAGRVGGAVAHAYFKEVDHYEVKKLRTAAGPGTWGRRKTVVFVNGWLQEHDTEFADWLRGTKGQFGNASNYGVIWESGRPVQKFAKAPSRVAVAAAAKAFARMVGSVAAAEAPCRIIANPWHVAFHKSSQVGVLNAEMLARHPGPPVTLMGHSLGARTILYTLLNLSGRGGRPVIRDVYLFGGAADSSRDWRRAAKAVGGMIYNFHSDNDAVLGTALRIANAGFTKPIGTTPIRRAGPNIVNFDCSDLVSGHDDYKRNLPKLLSRARSAGRT
ncbi:MAG: DUF726 domain-containing protein [Gammaproteobacteria bacterium]|nr:DUF726 domain-containing protein [Gammaproteobacteria bacterium]